ncbi:MAG: molecular chaperone DnaJ, partial [Planctomycetota bacterium]
PDHRNGIKGDLVVQVYIEVPKRLDADQERILRQLAELEESNVLPERKSFLEKLTNFFGGESSADSEPTS